MKNALFLFLLALIFSHSSIAQAQLLPIQVKGKWGFINDSGKVLVNPLYSSAREIGAYGILYNKGQDSCGIVTSEGHIDWFTDMRFVADWQQTPYLRKKDGSLLAFNLQTEEWLEMDFDSIAPLKNGFAKVLNGQKQGVLKGAETILPTEWAHIEQKKYCFIAKKGTERKVYNLRGEFVTDIKLDQKLHDTWWPLLIFQNAEGNIQLVNPSEKSSTEQKWLNVTPLFKNKFRMHGARKDAVFDIETGHEFPIEKSWRIEPYGAYYKIRQGNKSGILTKEGAIWIKPEYRDVRIGDKFIYLLGSQGWGLSLRNGNEILPCKFNEITLEGTDLFKVIRHGKWGLFKTDGTNFIPVQYDQLLIYSSLIKAFQGAKTTLYQLEKGPRITDSLVFNKTISSRSNRKKPRKSKRLISSKDTFNANSFANCCYYSEMLGVWRKMSYGDKGYKSYGAKYLEINSVGGTDFLLTKRTANKKVVRFTLDEDYTFNYRVGLMTKSNCNDEISPKFCGIDTDELIGDSINGIVRAISADGLMTLTKVNSASFLVAQSTYIGPANRRGYRRFNKGGTYTVTDTPGPYTVATQYEFKRRFGLLPTGGAFNIEELKHRYINIEGGKWGLLDERGDPMYDPTIKGRGVDKRAFYEYLQKPKWNYYVVSEGDSLGLLRFSRNNHPLVRPIINRAIKPIVCKDAVFYACTPFDSAYGYIDSLGTYIQHPTFDDATSLEEGRAYISTTSGWTLINRSFDTLENHHFRETRPFQNGLSQVCLSNNTWGIIDSTGAYAVVPKYFRMLPYTDQQTWAFAAGGWRILNNKGQEVGVSKYRQVSPFYHGRAFATNDRKKGYAVVNELGEPLSKPIYQVRDDFVSDGFAKVSKKRKYYLINKEGELVIKKGYDRMGDYSAGWILAKKGKSYWALSVRGEKVKLSSAFAYSGVFQSGLALTLSQGKYGYTDTTGKLVIATVYKEAGQFQQDRAFVTTSDKTRQCITPSGEVAFSYEGTLVSHFNKGVALFKDEEGFYFLNRNGLQIGERHFDEARPFKNGKARVKIGERWNLIDREGNLISRKGFLAINGTNGLTYCVTEWNGFGLVDASGKEVLLPIYDDIQKAGPNIVRVEHFDGTYYFDVVANKWLFHSSLY